MRHFKPGMLVGLGPGQFEHKDDVNPIYKGRIVRYDKDNKWMVRYQPYTGNGDGRKWQVSSFSELDMIRLPDESWDAERI